MDHVLSSCVPVTLILSASLVRVTSRSGLANSEKVNVSKERHWETDNSALLAAGGAPAPTAKAPAATSPVGFSPVPIPAATPLASDLFKVDTNGRIVW